MADWGDLATDRQDLGEQGRALLYQHGVGLAFLATIRKDSGPRLHPMCPILYDTGLFAFIIPSPKQYDLQRDGRYAMHSFPRPEDEDALYLSGQAVLIQGAELRAALSEQFVRERSQFQVQPPAPEDRLFEFDIQTCLVTRTSGHGDPSPRHEVWHPAPSN